MWKITFFWSEIGSGFEEPGSTPPRRISRSTPTPSGTKCTLTRVHVCTWCSISLWSNGSEEGNSPDNESLRTKVPAHLLAIQYRLKRFLFLWRGSVHDQVYIYQNMLPVLRRKFVSFAAPEECRYKIIVCYSPTTKANIMVASRAFFGGFRLSVLLTPIRNSSLDVVSFQNIANRCLIFADAI